MIEIKELSLLGSHRPLLALLPLFPILLLLTVCLLFPSLFLLLLLIDLYLFSNGLHDSHPYYLTDLLPVLLRLPQLHT